MTKESHEDKQYPVKSLHDFLFELDQGMDKIQKRHPNRACIFWNPVFTRCLATASHKAFGFRLVRFCSTDFRRVFLAYSIYAMYSQYRFFNRWERRVGLLLHMEEQMLTEKLDETKAAKAA